MIQMDIHYGDLLKILKFNSEPVFSKLHWPRNLFIKENPLPSYRSVIHIRIRKWQSIPFS